MWISRTHPAIVSICESWLHSGVDSWEISLQGYSIFRCDRLTSPHGGVILYVSSSLRPTLVHSEPAPDQLSEQIWVRIHPDSGLPILCGLVYRSPRGTSLDWLNPLYQFSHLPRICLFGDFNCPNINWNTLQASPCASLVERAFLETILNCGLSQVVNSPMRRSPAVQSYLDLLFVSDDHLVSNNHIYIVGYF